MRWLLWWRPPCLRRRVVVNLADTREVLLEGVLMSARGPWLTLESAFEVRPFEADPDKQRARADGTLVIHRGNISFLQVLP